MVIVVEQVKDQSPTVGFPSQLAQHVTARLQAEARPAGRGFSARRNSRLRISGPDDDTSTSGEPIQPALCSALSLAGLPACQNLEPLEGGLPCPDARPPWSRKRHSA